MLQTALVSRFQNGKALDFLTRLRMSMGMLLQRRDLHVSKSLALREACGPAMLAFLDILLRSSVVPWETRTRAEAFSIPKTWSCIQ